MSIRQGLADVGMRIEAVISEWWGRRIFLKYQPTEILLGEATHCKAVARYASNRS